MTELQLRAPLWSPIPRTLARVSAITALVAVLSAIITYESISLSFKVGRLSVPPLYDDVSYFLDAARWLSAVNARSVGANLYALFDQHAPFSTLTAIIGFKLFPGSYVGPYAVNAVIIAAFLLGVVRLVWHLSVIDIATCVIAAACVPMLSQTIAEARPDLSWGLALGIAVGAIVYRPLSGRSFGSNFLLGVLCGLAVAIKPSAFPASVACVVFAACAAMICDCLTSGMCGIRAATKQVLPIALIFGAGLFTGTASVLSVAFMKHVQYILNIMIYNRDIWALDLSPYDHLAYYAFGSAGKIALGNWFWVGVALFAFRLALAFRRRDLGRAVTLLAVVLVAYAIPTASSVKSYFLGAMFFGIFVVSMIMNYAAIIDYLNLNHASTCSISMQRRWFIVTGLRLMPLALVSMILFTALVRGQPAIATALDQNSMRDIRVATERVWSLLKENSIDRTKQPWRHYSDTLSVSFSSPNPVTPSTVQLYAVQSHIKLDVRSEILARMPDAAAKGLAAADFAVVTSSIPHNLPGPQMGDVLIRLLDADPHMCLVDAMGLLNTRVMRIYRRSDLGCHSPAPDAGSVLEPR